MKRFLSLFSALLTVLFLCGCISEVRVQSDFAEKSDKLEVHFIDVGQGDATLIKCGNSAMLIDAGENDKGTLVQNYISKQGIKSLDYFIVTHPDSDHCGGADVIITKYDIDTIIMPNYTKDTATYRDVIQALDNKQYKVTEPIVGDSYKLGNAEFTIIAPNKEGYGNETNNYSVGILLQHGDRKFIFTGDAEEEAEMDIVDNKIDISADVLKVGHHGSKTSSAKDFIDAVSPEYAVISCEENNEYGHPHAATLNTLRSSGIKVFRTDEQGSIVVISDGKKLTWNAAPSDTWKAGEPTKLAAAPAVSLKSYDSAASASNAAQQKEESSPAAAESGQPIAQGTQGITYILNEKSKKFHRPTCELLPTTNRSDSTQSRDEIIAQGYTPCKNCNP